MMAELGKLILTFGFFISLLAIFTGPGTPPSKPAGRDEHDRKQDKRP